MKTVYIIFEQGAGYIYDVYATAELANEKVEQLKAITDLDCFVILERQLRETNF